MALLHVEDLQVGFEDQVQPVISGIDLSLAAGETVALVGESGSGKSLTALALMRLLPRGARVRSGRIRFGGEDVLAMPPRRLNRLRGGEVAMLFQQPVSMLDPTATVGSQVAEAVRLHTGLSGRAAWDRVIELFRELGIPAPEARAGSYPHQFSGGMAQRVMMAAALAGSPRLLIADEPTTALDVTVQLQILQLLARERDARQLATLLISHDLGVVSALADRIIVLYAGRVVEEGPRQQILQRPQHPYTQALVRASLLAAEPDGSLFAIQGSLSRDDLALPGCHFLPRCATAAALGIQASCAVREPALVACGDAHRVRCHAPGRHDAATAPGPSLAAPPPAAGREPIVSLCTATKRYVFGGRLAVTPVDAIDLEIRRGEVLGLVGESGCGKSTLARVLLRMTPASGGKLVVAGHDLAGLKGSGLAALHRDSQLIFQDPVAALDPRMTIGASLDAALLHNGGGRAGDRRARVLEMLRRVGLAPAFHDRLPRECSGGQLQRAVIARALLMGPRVLICDEPTSALDASIRAQILNLLRGLRSTHDLSMLMISHDLRVVRHMCDRVAVMYLGELVEVAATEALFQNPAHPYTQALIAASLLEEHGLACGMGHLHGEPPSPLAPPAGCRFHTRCRLAGRACAENHPMLEEVMPAHLVRCRSWQKALAMAESSNAPHAPPVPA